MRINMRIYELIESRQHPVIVVDVQPEYCNYDSDNASTCRYIIDFVTNQTGKKLFLINGEDSGVSEDSLYDIVDYWEENSNTEIDWNSYEIVDKGYGYLRSWMDQDVDPKAIILTLREMLRQKVSDSRELYSGDEEQFQQLLGEHYEDWMIDDPITVGWLSLGKLKEFNGAYIVGGGRDECLREVELLMNAFNIKYKRIDSLTY